MPSSPAATPSIFTLLMKKLIQLEKTYFGALLFYLILLSLEKALVTMTKKALTSLCTFSIPQKNKLYFKSAVLSL